MIRILPSSLTAAASDLVVTFLDRPQAARLQQPVL
jgi:hypothetical protein